MEISIFLIIDLPKYHFLHQTDDNPSFEYFDILVSDMLWLKLFKNEEFEFENEFKFFNNSRSI